MTSLLQTEIDQSELARMLRRELDRGCLELPVLPSMASEVLALVGSEDSDARQIANLIHRDQTLAAHVMKVANSPIHAPEGNLVSLQQAIARLGIRAIGEIALWVTLGSATFVAPRYESKIKCELERSLHTALWSREIARECRKNVESVFLCGLLKSIGVPAGYHLLSSIEQETGIRPDPETTSAAVRRMNMELGIRLLAQWNLPRIILDVIKAFPQLAGITGPRAETVSAPLQRSVEMAAMVCLAEAIADQITTAQNHNVEQLLHEIGRQPTVSMLNLYPDQIRAILTQSDSIYRNLEVMAG